jgi:hypothetical protein
MSEKDAQSKKFLEVNERFADAFNYFMYDGRQVIKPQDLEERDVTELLTPIITLTIYWGAKQWDAPRSLHEMFSETDREEFARFVPDYWVNLIVPSEIKDFAKFSSVQNDVVHLLNTFTGLNLKANKKGDKTDMCKAAAELLSTTKAEGENKLSRLIKSLMADNRQDDLRRVLDDEKARQEMYKEYGITD